MREHETKRNILRELIPIMTYAILPFVSCKPSEKFIQPTVSVSGQGRVTAENNGFYLTASCAEEGHKLGKLELGPHIDLELATSGKQEQVRVYIKKPPPFPKMAAVQLLPRETTVIHGVDSTMIFGPNIKYEADAYAGELDTEELIGRIEFTVKCP